MTPGISTCSFFNTPRKFCFSGIAHFGEFRPKTYSFTENFECQLKSGRRQMQKTIKKCQKLSKSWHFSHLKAVYKMLKLGIFLVFDNAFIANILRTWEKEGGLLPSEPVSQYRCSVRAFLKLMIMIEHMKKIRIPCLDIWSMLRSGQVPQRSNSSHLFWYLLSNDKWYCWVRRDNFR